MNAWIQSMPDGVRLAIHAVPGARQTIVDGLHGPRLKLRIQAPPVDGKANQALIAYLAKTLDVPKTGIRLIRGETSREKDVTIRGMTVAAVTARLLPGP